MVGAGEWQALENGSRWRMAGAGEGKGNSGSCPNIDSVTDLFPGAHRS